MFQLCTLDEYGSVSILTSSKDVEGLVLRAKELVNVENMQNALTIDAQVKSFTAVWLEFYIKKNIVDNVFYAGKNGQGQHVVCVLDKDKPKKVKLSEAIKEGALSYRFYIGTVVRDRKNDIEDYYYASTPRGEEINTIDNSLLRDKTFFFICPIGE